MWCHFSGKLSEENETNEMKSTIMVVEGCGKECVEPHGKKGDARQDKHLWSRKVTFGFAEYSYEKQMVHLFL